MNETGSSSGSGLTRHFAHSGYELSFFEWFLLSVFMCERMRVSNDVFILFLCVIRLKGCSRGCEGANGFKGLWNLNSMVNKAV